MKIRNIIIDCDPGIDDVVALSLAIANSDKLNILGITTVAGNQDIEKVTKNTLGLMSYYDKDIKVAKGAKCPLIRERRPAINVHGENGVGNYEFPQTKNLYSNNAVTFLRDIILLNPIVHFIELIRGAYFDSLDTKYVSYSYILLWTLIPFWLGLFLYQRSEHKIIAS